LKTRARDYLSEILKLGRLQLLPITLLTLLAGVASYSELSSGLMLEVSGLSILINYLSFAPNEYFDYEIDRENERKEIMGVFIQEKKLAKYSVLVIFGFAGISSFFLSETVRMAIWVIMAISILYSAPPFRFKGRAPLDAFCNILGVFFIFATGVGIAGGNLSDVIPGAYWFSALIGFGAHGMLAVPDMETDKGENLRTMPMIIGQKGIVLITQALIITAVLMENFSSLTTSVLLASAVALIYLWKERTTEEITKFAIFGVIVIPIYLVTYILTRGVL
jgi:4-hydroxybenzoate polyprenyltransferase